MAAAQVKRPTGHKRLKRAGEGRQAADAEEMRAELFGDAEGEGACGCTCTQIRAHAHAHTPSPSEASDRL
jgi:hypothetical protein